MRYTIRWYEFNLEMKFDVERGIPLLLADMFGHSSHTSVQQVNMLIDQGYSSPTITATMRSSAGDQQHLWKLQRIRFVSSLLSLCGAVGSYRVW